MAGVLPQLQPSARCFRQSVGFVFSQGAKGHIQNILGSLAPNEEGSYEKLGLRRNF